MTAVIIQSNKIVLNEVKALSTTGATIWKKLNKLFGQPNIVLYVSIHPVFTEDLLLVRICSKCWENITKQNPCPCENFIPMGKT